MGSLVALTMTASSDAFPAYRTFIAALKMGLARRGALRQTPLEILTLTRLSRQVSQPVKIVPLTDSGRPLNTCIPEDHGSSRHASFSDV